MGVGLGVMFLGLSYLASKVHVAPYESGTPTVIAQVGEAVYGQGVFGEVLFYSLQAGTMLILVLAANTGFADFPRLASFQAGDRFLPRQLTKRGHRLVYSNGVLALAGAAAVLVMVTRAEVTRLIPLYAIGVFTGFTLSQAGMTKHHIRKKEQGCRRVSPSTASAPCCRPSWPSSSRSRSSPRAPGSSSSPCRCWCSCSCGCTASTRASGQLLESDDVPTAAKAQILRRHVVLVFVDKLDMATARAVQYARTLTPDDLRAVHFAVDPDVAAELAAPGQQTGLARITLDLVDCPDRRLPSAARRPGGPRAGGRRHRGLGPAARPQVPGPVAPHPPRPDGGEIERAVSRLAHANVTTVPFHFGPGGDQRGHPPQARGSPRSP